MDMKTAVLVMNLGTPDDTRTISVRRYLREFLGDGRVVDVNAILRYILVNLIIAPIRGFKSAALYKDVWTENGSLLKYHLNELVKKLQDRYVEEVNVCGEMRYQNPSLPHVLAKIDPSLNSNDYWVDAVKEIIDKNRLYK